MKKLKIIIGLLVVLMVGVAVSDAGSSGWHSTCDSGRSTGSSGTKENNPNNPGGMETSREIGQNNPSGDDMDDDDDDDDDEEDKD